MHHFIPVMAHFVVKTVTKMVDLILGWTVQMIHVNRYHQSTLKLTQIKMLLLQDVCPVIHNPVQNPNDCVNISGVYAVYALPI